MLNMKAISIALKPRSAACSKTINRRAPSVMVNPLYDIAAVYRLRIGAGFDSETGRGGHGDIDTPTVVPAAPPSISGIFCTPFTALAVEGGRDVASCCKAVAPCGVDIPLRSYRTTSTAGDGVVEADDSRAS